ncbi:MAG: hypothetical protein HFI29_03005 [Lachnospiraceae bacterium]|nr:hypothetical protein [Lachnospiraceae bacterium]
MRSEQQEKLLHFLEDVDEQISYRPVHAAVNEELRAHVEDKAEVYMEYGVEEGEAYDKAIRDMGDASVIGLKMNEAHHLRTAKPLLASLLALICLGVAGNFVGRGFSIEEIFYNGYFLWGFLVLILVARYGYPFLLKYTGKILTLLAVAGVLFAASRTVTRYTGSFFPSIANFHPYSPSVIFGILQVAVPASVVLLYRRRRQGYRSLLLIAGVQLLLVALVAYCLFWGYADVAFLTFLCSCLGAELYMIGKKYLNVDKKKGFGTAIACFLILVLVWAGCQGQRFCQTLELFVNPGAQAEDPWQDGYNNVLIRELLGRAKGFGEVSLSEEELVRYRTAQWYYEDGPGVWKGDGIHETLEDYAKYRMQYQYSDGPGLWDILPQHYHNNYRIAWWILRYGWIPGILFTLFLCAAYGLLFVTAFRIRNRLGRMVALAGSLAMWMQFLFYLLGNFGCQFGMFGNLPFVSEGFASVTGSALMAGLILSAYRFDTVVTEKE